MIVSGPAKHGKTTSMKLFVRQLIEDEQFRALCPVYAIVNKGRTFLDIDKLPDSIQEKGDWIVAFYKSRKDRDEHKPCGYVVTAGDTLDDKLRKLYEAFFGTPTVKFIVGAARPWNNVHRFLLDTGKKQGVVNVAASPYGYYEDAADASSLTGKYDKYVKELKDIFFSLYINK